MWLNVGMGATNTTATALTAVDAAWSALIEAERIAAWTTEKQIRVHQKVAKEVNLWSDQDLEWWLKTRREAADERRQANALVELRRQEYAQACRAAREKF
jgi:hypothetical protein